MVRTVGDESVQDWDHSIGARLMDWCETRASDAHHARGCVCANGHDGDACDYACGCSRTMVSTTSGPYLAKPYPG